jgi:hypothetical protein
MSVSDLPEKVKYLLWAKSAGRCEFDGCNKPLWHDGLTQIEMNFADIAHIIGDKERGPRGDKELSPEYCRDINNLMLMCLDHHRMVDREPSVYSDDLLRQMKKAHEERMQRLTAIRSDRTSQVLIYKGIIGVHQPKINRQDAWQAMHPSWYPANLLPIELGLVNSEVQDDEAEFWVVEERNLDRQFNSKVKPLIDNPTERNHFSVFAIGPQPLLIKLGTLFSDIYPAEVYQLHREPPTWEWQLGPEKFEYIIQEPTSYQGHIALNLSLSATIDSSRIKDVFGEEKYSEWKFTIANPHNDYLRSKAQLLMFREEFRKLLDRIKSKHGENVGLHIFPAVPVSVAVEIGRVWQPKADLPMIVYDQNRKLKGFVRGLNIGDAK